MSPCDNVNFRALFRAADDAHDASVQESCTSTTVPASYIDAAKIFYADTLVISIKHFNRAALLKLPVTTVTSCQR
jgi:hypothetical protein